MEGKSQLLSNLIVKTTQRLVIVIDETGREKCGNRILHQFLTEQGIEKSNIRTLPLDKKLQDISHISQFLADLRSQGKTEKNLHIVLPTLADLLCYMQASMIFELLHELRNCAGIQCTLIWASTPHLIFPKMNFLIAACEYVCDTVIHLLDAQNLTFTAQKPGGGITSKTYKYKINQNGFHIEINSAQDEKRLEEPNKSQNNSSAAAGGAAQGGSSSTIEHESTFKIELEEEELVARNAMKLPYEKTTEAGSSGGAIVYTPDASDDFDDEDPDEDLCI